MTYLRKEQNCKNLWNLLYYYTESAKVLLKRAFSGCTQRSFLNISNIKFMKYVPT